MISVQSVVDEIKKEFGSFFSTEWHPDTDVMNYITKGLRWISNKRDWEFNKVKTNVITTIVDEIVAIPETIQCYNVLDSDKKPLIIYEFDDYYAQVASSVPYCWVWDTTFIASNPGVYTILHSIYPDPVTSLSWNISIPDSMKDLIVEISLAFWFLSVKDDDNAFVHFKVAEDLLPPIASRKTNNTPNQNIRMWSKYRV